MRRKRSDKKKRTFCFRKLVKSRRQQERDVCTCHAFHLEIKTNVNNNITV